jgi:chromosome segregation ATPase
LLFVEQGMSEKMSKQVEAQISDLNAQLEESQRTISDLNSSKSRMQNENADLTRQLEDAESRLNQLAREKSNLASQLDEAKRSLEDESRVRS